MSPSAGLVAQAESVFESYLAARVVRARRDLTAAKISLLRDPKNRTKLDAVRRAEIEIEQLQSQLVEQTRKATQARARASQATATESTTPSANAPSTEPASPRRVSAEVRDCPHCKRKVSGHIGTCTCGHRFTTDATHLTAQFLSEEEFLALRTPRK